MLTPVCVFVFWKYLNGENYRLNWTEILTMMLLLWYNRIIIKNTFSPSRCLLTFPPCVLSEQDLISLDNSRRLVNSKHNQTLWSVSLWRGIESISCRVLWWQDLQLPSACECSLCWNFSISSLHSSCPHPKPTSSSGGGSNTADRVIRAPRGDPSKLQWIPRFVWEQIHVYTNRRCSELFS